MEVRQPGKLDLVCNANNFCEGVRAWSGLAWPGLGMATGIGAGGWAGLVECSMGLDGWAFEIWIALDCQMGWLTGMITITGLSNVVTLSFSVEGRQRG